MRKLVTDALGALVKTCTRPLISLQRPYPPAATATGRPKLVGLPVCPIPSIDPSSSVGTSGRRSCGTWSVGKILIMNIDQWFTVSGIQEIGNFGDDDELLPQDN